MMTMGRSRLCSDYRPVKHYHGRDIIIHERICDDLLIELLRVWSAKEFDRSRHGDLCNEIRKRIGARDVDDPEWRSRPIGGIREPPP